MVSPELVQFPHSWRQPTRPGYGTFPQPFATGLSDYARTARGVQVYIEQALVCGYRHIDTAFAYRNQDLVGAAVQAQKIARGDVFVTSKLHCNNNSYAEARQKIKEAIGMIWDLETEKRYAYLDCFLIHYPAFGDPIGAWRAMDEAREQEVIRHAGVSNFEARHLSILREQCGEYPEVNQIEFHPYIYHEQLETIEFCREHGIELEGYCPFAQGKVLQDPVVSEIARTHQCSKAAVILKWCYQKEIKPIIGTRSTSHLQSNADLSDWRLSPGESAAIDSLSRNSLTRISLQWNWNPQKAPLGGPKWKGKLNSARQKVRKLVGVLVPGRLLPGRRNGIARERGAL